MATDEKGRMPQPDHDPAARTTVEDSFFDLLIETLADVEKPARGQFLQRFFRSVAQVEFTEAQSLDFWEKILARREELNASLGRAVSLRTAMVDVLTSGEFLRLPVLMEYEQLKTLRISAATDPLTGLYNRRLFRDYFERELIRAKRYRHHLSLVLLDMHRMKEVNDRFGHLRGDQVLQAAAATLRKTLRASDFSFRIGGDEFALLLPEADPEQASTLARRIRTNFAASILPLRLEMQVALDFGVAVHPEDGEEEEILTQKADERLYQLKHAAAEAQHASVPPQQTVTAGSRVIPLGIQGVRETPESPRPEKTAAGSSEAGARSDAAERRRWERVSLAGTRAYAQLGEAHGQSIPVLDLSFGGAALLIDPNEELPVQFSAVLHVPILPPVRVNLRKSYVLRLESGRTRVGCVFSS